MLAMPQEYQLMLPVIILLLFLILILYLKLNKRNSKLDKVVIEKSVLQENLTTQINHQKSEIEEFKIKFSHVFNKEEALTKLNLSISERNIELTSLQKSYADKKMIFDHLKAEAAIYDETIELAELGFYKPSFSFEHSEQYKESIILNKSKSKEMIVNKKAIICNTTWTVDGSEARGRTKTNRNIKLTARAFNNECEAAISKVKWNNAYKMVARIEKTFHAINKLNESNLIFISPEYMILKVEELKLTFEYSLKKQQEKEEQAEIRQQMRDEIALEKEITSAIKDESKYQDLLEKANKQAAKLSGEKLIELQNKIEKLNSKLVEAHNKSERAKSMAEQTKAGHVYVISNLGSFGEDVYKIGMTRRLDPLDRVKELGGASVPFLFDIHAMIYTEDAPKLEKELHSEFNKKRLNLVNNRKEFFNVKLSEIEKIVNEKHINAEFYLTAEARQYRESQALRKQKNEYNEKEIRYPETI